VHIERGHKDRDLEAGIIKILILKCLFNDYYLTVGRRIDEPVIRLKVACGPPEKEKQKCVKHQGTYDKSPLNKVIVSPQDVYNKIYDN
jgi:hypothetical protein